MHAGMPDSRFFESTRGRIVALLRRAQHTVEELARILIAAVGSDVEPQFNPRDVLVSRRAADITRAKEILGFEAEVAVRDGMTRLVQNT